MSMLTSSLASKRFVWSDEYICEHALHLALLPQTCSITLHLSLGWCVYLALGATAGLAEGKDFPEGNTDFYFYLFIYFPHKIRARQGWRSRRATQGPGAACSRPAAGLRRHGGRQQRAAHRARHRARPARPPPLLRRQHSGTATFALLLHAWK